MSIDPVDAAANGVTPEMMAALTLGNNKYAPMVRQLIAADPDEIWGLRYLIEHNSREKKNAALTGLWGDIPDDHKDDLRVRGHTKTGLMSGKGLGGADVALGDFKTDLAALLEDDERDEAIQYIIGSVDLIGKQHADDLLKILYR